MNDIWDFLKFMGWVFIGVLVLLCIGVEINYSVQNVPLRVVLDGIEVYHGRSACVNTVSVGSSARIDVSQGFGCIFPKAHYAGKNLVITTENK